MTEKNSLFHTLKWLLKKNELLMLGFNNNGFFACFTLINNTIYLRAYMAFWLENLLNGGRLLQKYKAHWRKISGDTADSLFDRKIK